MAKMDEVKAEIAFMTMFIGAIILAVGGISSLHLTGERTAIYWLGILVVAVFAVACLYLAFRIRQQIRYLGEL